MSQLKPLITYDIIASSLTVMDIAVPLYEARPEWTIAHLHEIADAEWESEWQAVVQSDDDVRRYIDFQIPSSLHTVAEAAYLPSSSEKIPYTTPLIEMPALFSDGRYYFVETESGITHFVRRQELFNLPMSLCLFALTIELEILMLWWLKQGSRKSWQRRVDCLSERRYQAAMRARERRAETGLVIDAIDCTSFSDRVYMFLADRSLAAKLPPVSGDWHETMARATDMRNRLAHGESVMRLFVHPQSLSLMVEKLRAAIAALQVE